MQKRIVFISFIIVLLGFLTQAIIKDDKYFLSVVSIIKNEKPYLKEWIEFHRLQGVEHFYICDNGSTDGTSEYLTPYIDNNLITYIPLEGKNKQLECYEKVVKEYGKETTWLAIIDLDEFMVPLQKNKMTDFLKEFEEESEISLHWQNYGSNGIYQRQQGLVIEDFTAHGKQLNHTVKSIVRPEAVRDFKAFGSNHYVSVNGKSVNEYHKPVSFMLSFNISADKARINHYITKSFSEFINKKRRGHPEGTSIDYTYYFFHNENEVKNDESMLRFIPKLKEAMKKSPLPNVQIPISHDLPNKKEDFRFNETESALMFGSSYHQTLTYEEALKIYHQQKYPSYKR